MDQNPAPSGGKQKNTAMAIIAYIIFFIPLLTGDAKKDDFVNYHTKQGLVLFILSIIVWIIGAMLPWSLWPIHTLLNLGVLVLFIIGIINAASGKKQPLPLVGQFADNFKF